METRIERILILAKTYPSPSAKHIETSCVAGITQDGCMRRLYPVPFRLVEEDKQFKKWQWVEVRVEKAPKDHRAESHRLFVDTIECGEAITTKGQWRDRWPWIDRLPAYDDFHELRDESGLSLGLVRPREVVGLDIVEARNSDWTDEEREKLLRCERQFPLFSDDEVKKYTKTLRKVPFDFYYRYICQTPEGQVECRHKLVDWEVGVLFWNCRRSHGPNWEQPFRQKLEADLMGRELMFLMGNQHRFQDQWLIISLIYPPKRPPDDSRQLDLL